MLGFSFILNRQLYKLLFFPPRCENTSGGQSTQIKYLSKSTDMYNKILLQ